MIETVLSLFPGVGLLEMPFVEAGYSVVRGPDLFHGGDMRSFRVSRGIYTGILAGPPCQGFSAANEFRGDMTHHSVINSLEMLAITVKTIEAAQPSWFLIENVPSVPSVLIDGYKIQTIAVNDYEFGGDQIRWRKLQFGHIHGSATCRKRMQKNRERSDADFFHAANPVFSKFFSNLNNLQKNR